MALTNTHSDWKFLDSSVCESYFSYTCESFISHGGV